MIGRERRLRSFLDQILEIDLIQLLLLLFGSDGCPPVLMQVFALLRPGGPFPNSAKCMAAPETSFFDRLNNNPSVVFENLKFAFNRRS